MDAVVFSVDWARCAVCGTGFAILAGAEGFDSIAAQRVGGLQEGV